MSNLKAIKRDSTSSGSNNKLRSEGLIPAILYGGKDSNQNISVKKKEIQSLVYSDTLIPGKSKKDLLDVIYSNIIKINTFLRGKSVTIV